MSETSDRLLRGYQAQEKRFLERRFPLRFTPRTRSCASCTVRPRASAGIPRPTSRGSRFDPEAYAGGARGGAPGVEPPGVGHLSGARENTALLIRFCLESGAAGMDAKLFLSFRPAEEAKHLEACFLFAGAWAATSPPRPRGLARASNQPFAQMALDPDVSVEAVVAALGEQYVVPCRVYLVPVRIAARAGGRWSISVPTTSTSAYMPKTCAPMIGNTSLWP